MSRVQVVCDACGATHYADAPAPAPLPADTPQITGTTSLSAQDSGQPVQDALSDDDALDRAISLLSGAYFEQAFRRDIYRAGYAAALAQRDVPREPTQIDLAASSLEGSLLLALADAAVEKMTPDDRSLVVRVAQADAAAKKAARPGQGQRFLFDRLYALGKSCGMSARLEPDATLACITALRRVAELENGRLPDDVFRAVDQALEMVDAAPQERSDAQRDDDARDVRAKYGELLYAVAKKHPGETRHETALRYIREREAPSTNDPQAPMQEVR